MSPPALNDQPPVGKHVLTPTPIGNTNTAATATTSTPGATTIVTPESNTLFSGSYLPPALHALLSAQQKFSKDSGDVEYFQDEECTIDTEVSVWIC